MMAGLYETWEMTTQSIKDPAVRNIFYADYFDREQHSYEILLGEALEDNTHFEGPISELAEKLALEPVAFAAFLDGINTSLKEPVPLQDLKEDTVVTLDVNVPLLYRNMLDAHAEHLYRLPQWDRLLTDTERSDIRRAWVADKQAVRTVTAGRNDPCPCGSGKKYKKCCWDKDHAAQEA